MEGLGFHAYEVSNHAKGPAARSRHNLIYWRGHDYIGVGPGAHGRLPGPDPGTRLATEAEKGVRAYIACVRDTGFGWTQTEAYSPQAAAEERVLMGLRIDEGVRLAELSALPRLDPQPFIDLGLLRQVDQRLSATAKGRLVLDRLTLELLR